MGLRRVLWLLLCARCAPATVVPAPANVSVVCKNFQPVVSWTYSELLVDTRFRVSIISKPTSSGEEPGVQQVMTDDLWYDLTSVVWASLWSSRDAFAVNVSAVRGHDGQESNVTPSPLFTFNQLRGNWVQMHCTLDLPHVDLVLDGQQASLSFLNPLKTRPELRWAREHQASDPLALSFDVTEDGGIETSGTCGAPEQMCTLDFSLLHERVNQCVSINTWLKNDVLEVAFNPVDVVCGLPGGDAGAHGLLLGLLLAGFLLAVFAVVFMVWKSQACVRRVPPFPFPFPDPPSPSPRFMELQSEKVSLVRTVERGPATASEEEEPVGVLEPVGELEEAVGVLEEEEHVGVLEEEEPVGVLEEEPVGVLEPVGDLEEEPVGVLEPVGELEEEPVGVPEPTHGYEPRPRFPVDMGRGDVVQGYGP